MKIGVVTDSGAQFVAPRYASQQQVTVVPYTLTLNNKTYRDGLDLNAEDASRLLLHSGQTKAQILPPSVEDYLAVYGRLVTEYDALISIHTSRELTASAVNAGQAARHFNGNCPIAVIDSQSVCAGQGLLVKEAVQAVAQGQNYDEIVRLLRGMVEHLYSIYYVESVNYLVQSELLSLPHGLLSAYFAVKLVLSLDEGHLHPVEKVRTRAQAVERLVEFASEFGDQDEIVLVQPRTLLAEPTRMIHDRLLNEFPNLHVPYIQYNMVLAGLLGLDAFGVVILEKEKRAFEDDL